MVSMTGGGVGGTAGVGGIGFARGKLGTGAGTDGVMVVVRNTTGGGLGGGMKAVTAGGAGGVGGVGVGGTGTGGGSKLRAVGTAETGGEIPWSGRG